jgi:histidinol-phosphate aminotransferase
MFEPEGLIRSHIREMPPYEPILPFEVLSEQLGIPVEDIVKLDANENPYGPLPAVKEALANLAHPHIYPDPESRQLRAALCAYHQVPVENILVGAGADELIDLTLRLLIEPGDAILNCPPTFGMYTFDGDLNGARIISVPRMIDFAIDVNAIETAARTERPKLIFLANPNNPDGGLVAREDIERLLRLPLIVVLDEAYVQFAPPEAGMIREVLERKNLIVLRTFSKWAGLAGLRAGYGIFPIELMSDLWKIKQPYNLSVAASAAACAALLSASQLDARTAAIIAERERLFLQLQEISYLEPVPSHANFILCRVTGRDAKELKEDLARRGILVRFFDKPGLQQTIRISIGRTEHTAALIQALKELEANA